jgi:hypothetical protein
MSHIDGTPPFTGLVPASGRITQVRSTDMLPGDWQFTIQEVIDGVVRRQAVRRLIHPSRWVWTFGVEFTWRAPSDAPGEQTVSVTARFADAPCQVDWGDGSPPETMPVGVSLHHQFPVPQTGAGTRVTVTEDAPAGVPPRTFTRVLGTPRYIGVPTLNARNNRTVDLDVAGLNHLYNDDWYTVDWGDGVADQLGAIGNWFPAHHFYNADGTYTVTVDGPGMVAPVRQTVTVVTYPAPTVSVTEFRDKEGHAVDPDRMTAQISIDNTASGGGCQLDFGDGTPPVITQQNEIVQHKYAAPETYWVVAESLADPTAKGRSPVTVPFAAERTLQFRLDVAGYTATLTVTDFKPGAIAEVVWASGIPAERVPPSAVLDHTYTVPDVYNVTVRYADGSESYDTPIMVPNTRRPA